MTGCWWRWRFVPGETAGLADTREAQYSRHVGAEHTPGSKKSSSKSSSKSSRSTSTSSPRGPSVSFSPRAFGDYDLLAPLAEGGMGAVYLARRRGFGKDVQRFCAVKTLLRSLSAQPSFVARFQDEARVVVTLSHRALCHVFDVGVVNGESYLAMELIEGVSLRQLQQALTERGETLPVDVALAIADEVADALAHVHERRDPLTGQPLHIVHRDISPQNILVTFQGAVKIVDFGIVSSSLRQERTASGMVVGKLHYMAPEQARAEPSTAATDVFSTGVVLWELVTGQRFWGDADKGVIAMELSDGTFTPSYDEVPAPLRSVLRDAMAPESEARLGSGAALLTALAAIELPRASSRTLRLLVERILPDEQGRLERLMQGAAAVVVDSPAEPTKITRLASAPSTEGLPGDSARATVTVGRAVIDGVIPDSVHTEATAIRSPPKAPRAATSSPTPASRSPVVLAAATVLVSMTVVLGAWWMLKPPPEPPTPTMPVSPSVAVQEAPPAPPSPSPSPSPSPPAASPSPPVQGPTEAPDVPQSPPVKVARVRPGPTSPRPPAVVLTDLGSHLDYLERWCIGPTTCARSLVDERRRVPLLDPAGLRALRDEAARCVARCRR
jgi:hypothetical protein